MVAITSAGHAARWQHPLMIGNGIEGFASMTAIQERTAEAFQMHIAGLAESTVSLPWTS
jgi:hypothetical protein